VVEIQGLQLKASQRNSLNLKAFTKRLEEVKKEIADKAALTRLFEPSW
jgi:hypothetical protein